MAQLQAMNENPLIEAISEEAGGEEADPLFNFFAVLTPDFTVMFAFFLGGAFLVGSTTPLYTQGGVIGFPSNLTPHAHALEAYRLIRIDGGSLGEILLQNLILLGFTAVFCVVAVRRVKLT